MDRASDITETVSWLRKQSMRKDISAKMREAYRKRYEKAKKKSKEATNEIVRQAGDPSPATP